MPEFHPFRNLYGDTEIFDFLAADRDMADIGQGVFYWSPTLCRLPAGPRWLQQDDPFQRLVSPTRRGESVC
jgi:hypothetical protein